MGLFHSAITPNPFGPGTARRGEAKRRQARSGHGSISASGSSPPQSPPREFRQEVKPQGLRDHGAWARFSRRTFSWDWETNEGPGVRETCLGLPITQAGRWPFCYFKILFPHAEQCLPSGCSAQTCCLQAFRSGCSPLSRHGDLLRLSSTGPGCWRCPLPAMPTASDAHCHLSRGSGWSSAWEEEMPSPCHIQPSKQRCRKEFSCWVPTGGRNSRKLIKIWNFACCNQHREH